MKIAYKTIAWVIVFALAMGFLEASVVVYLREIYYPGGFTFPLKPIHARDLLVEIGREASTVLMLIAVGVLSGKNARQRFAFFLLSFGVWDIAYYVFLKAILGWPSGPGTWDILFLIPVPWVGPVWAPCLLSATMIFFSSLVIRLENRRGRAVVNVGALTCLILGSVIVIASFVEDPLRHLAAMQANSYVPAGFPAWLFGLGEVVILSGVAPDIPGIP